MLFLLLFLIFKLFYHLFGYFSSFGLFEFVQEFSRNALIHLNSFDFHCFLNLTVGISQSIYF
jgi:hypothetical protein